MQADLKSIKKHTKILSDIAQNLTFGILSEMSQEDISWRRHISPEGVFVFDHMDQALTDPLELLKRPFYLGSGVLSLLTDLVAFELESDVKDGCVSTLSRYPFVFLACSFPDLDPFVRDVSFSEFLLIGGNSGVTRDALGCITFLETDPGSLLEHNSFLSPSNLIAPGYSDSSIKTLRGLERACRKKVMRSKGSTLNSVYEQFKSVSQTKVRFLYGASSYPFNHIDEVLESLK